MFKWIFAGCAYLVAVVLVSVHLLPIKQDVTAGNEARTSALTARSASSWRPQHAPTSVARPAHQTVAAANEARRSRSTTSVGSVATVEVASEPDEPARQRWTFRIVDADPAIAPATHGGNNSYALARSIQRELNRVGCANLTITGSWDRRTRSAMASFAARRNAMLPTNKPDVILLSLLKNYQGTDCGRSASTQIAHQGEQRRLHTAPRLIRRLQRQTVISGWSAQTSTTTRPGTDGSVASGVQQPTSHATVAPSYYRPVAPGRLDENRMALGVRPADRAPGSPPPVTVQPPGHLYTNEIPYDEARRLDAARAAALERAQQAEKQRQRRSRRRAYRRRATWKTRAFSPQN